MFGIFCFGRGIFIPKGVLSDCDCGTIRADRETYKGEENMLYITSSETRAKRKIYHVPGCIYEKRIKPENKVKLSKKQIKSAQFCGCKYCCGQRSDAVYFRENLEHWQESKGMEIRYDLKENTLYMMTRAGFWKTFRSAKTRKFVLLHRNGFEPEMTFEDAMRGDFHLQRDFGQTIVIEEVLNYISAHDKAMIIIQDDYRKLPQKTKKQKKYYKQAELRVKRNTMRRLDNIFAMLEAQNPELKYAAYA